MSHSSTHPDQARPRRLHTSATVACLAATLGVVAAIATPGPSTAPRPTGPGWAAAAAPELSVAILTAEGALGPHECGSAWPELARRPGGFAANDHTQHRHLRWRSE